MMDSFPGWKPRTSVRGGGVFFDRRTAKSESWMRMELIPAAVARCRSRTRRFLAAAIAGAIVAGSLCLGGSWSAAAAQSPKGVLVDLNGTGELRTRFNADLGKPRLVLLLSPT